MKKALFFLLAIAASISLQAQEYRFNSEPNGFSVSNRNSDHLTIKHNLGAVTIESADRAEVQGQTITLSGVYLSNVDKMKDAESRIDTSKFGDGIYTLQVIQNGDVSNVKIVVMP